MKTVIPKDFLEKINMGKVLRYGIFMLVLLISGVVRLDAVQSTASFLIEIMPVMFIPAGVGLLTAWPSLRSVLLPVLVITVVTTFIVMAVTGKVTDFMIGRSKKHE